MCVREREGGRASDIRSLGCSIYRSLSLVSSQRPFLLVGRGERSAECFHQQCDVNYFEIRRAIGIRYRMVLRFSLEKIDGYYIFDM